MKRKSVILILLVLSLLVHFISLSHPDQVIFDEVHWGKYISAYTGSHENFFDVHPPHGKLMVAGLAYLTGYRGDQSFEKIGLPYEKVSAFTVRFLPALAGSLIPLVTFGLIELLGGTLPIAFLGGLFCLLDNSLLLQSKVMGLYTLLLLAILVSLYLFLLGEKKNSSFYYSLAGVACGFSAGFQFTGICALVLIGLINIFRFIKNKNVKHFLFSSSYILFYGILTYLIGWWIHFSLLYKGGTGDAFYRNTGTFAVDFFQLHKIMYNASATLLTPHPDASPWWSWPLIKKPIYYWQGKQICLYLVGNPFVWWSICSAMIVALIDTGKKLLFSPIKKWSKIFSEPYYIPLIGFFIAYLPLTTMKRTLFLYHFITPLHYAVIFALLYWANEWLKDKRVYASAIILSVLAFIWVSPVTYAYSVPAWWWKSFPWIFYH